MDCCGIGDAMRPRLSVERAAGADAPEGAPLFREICVSSGGAEVERRNSSGGEGGGVSADAGMPDALDKDARAIDSAGSTLHDEAAAGAGASQASGGGAVACGPKAAPGRRGP
eukprot:7121215-Prymnesium_polylepis.3